MEHISIDLGSKDRQVCVRSADGEIVGRLRYCGRWVRRHGRCTSDAKRIPWCNGRNRSQNRRGSQVAIS
jgi:hypothetical protein